MALRGERERLLADLGTQGRELERVYGEEKGLRETVADQEAHIGRLYGELERLRALIDEMRATRAWRLHEWLERRRR